MDGLRRTEAAERARLLHVRGYDVELDLSRGADDGAETFGSVSRIAFDCVEPGSSTFLDLTAARVDSVVLNGRPLDPGAAGTGRRLALSDLEARNELVVVAEMAYSRTGEGFHRFVDPADDEVYTWTETALYNTNRVYGCFDQPDLKAPLRLRVKAPESWIVLSNGAGSPVGPGHWEFAETPPLSTYLIVVVAGPYHAVYEDHGPIRLGLQVRRSLAEHLDADELFAHTRASFDVLHRFFDVPYPFGKYDQAFVPEFGMGAMENPGCVKFADRFVYRSRVTDAQRETRAMVIAHEMAHMWFGDLVTMRWWADLWLNESFAEYMGHSTATHIGFESAWAAFCATTKAWGYHQDELPSTHPIAADAPDTDAALLNFDGISYAKGAGVLKQLVAWVGPEAFRAGVRAYIREHAYGNTDLADLLAALERSSGRDLRAWSGEWLEAAGVNVLRPEPIEEGGTYREVTVAQSAPASHPTLRSHRIAIGAYDRVGERLVRRDRIEVDVAGARTEVAALAGATVPDLLLLNDDDLTWAKIRLDERSLATIRDGGFGRLDDPLARALIWSSVWDMTRDAELAVGEYLALVVDGIGAERAVSLVHDILLRARRAVDILGRPEERDERLAALAWRCLDLLSTAEPGSDLQLAYARGYAAAVVAPGDVARVRGWLDGLDVPTDLAIDPDLRWLVVRRLAVIGAIGEAEIAAELARDQTSSGTESAAGARAALPSEATKADAWASLVESDALSSAMQRAVSADFWQPEQLELCAGYVERYFAALPGLWQTRTAEAAGHLTDALFPTLVVAAETIDRVDRFLETGPVPALRRILVEKRADVERALRTRDADSAAVPA